MTIRRKTWLWLQVLLLPVLSAAACQTRVLWQQGGPQRLLRHRVEVLIWLVTPQEWRPLGRLLAALAMASLPPPEPRRPSKQLTLQPTLRLQLQQPRQQTPQVRRLLLQSSLATRLMPLQLQEKLQMLPSLRVRR